MGDSLEDRPDLLLVLADVTDGLIDPASLTTDVALREKVAQAMFPGAFSRRGEGRRLDLADAAIAAVVEHLSGGAK